MGLLERLQTIEDKFNGIKKPKLFKGKKKKKVSVRGYSKRPPRVYKLYIKSIWWTRRKNDYYQNHKKRCALCSSCEHVQLHHLKYGNFGFEKDEDLIPLCKQHHEEFHIEFGCNPKTMMKDMKDFFMDYMDKQI